MLTLGIDVGTGSVHAVTVDPERGIVGRGTGEYGVMTPHPGWAEQDPEDWWRAVCAATRSALSRTGPPDAVAVSGQGAAAVLLDERHRPIRPALIHLDQRAGPQAAELASGEFAAVLRKASGNAVGAWNTTAKVCWLRTHEPDASRRARFVTSAAGFVIARMTGRAMQSVSDAGISDLFDLTRRDWSPDLCALAEVPAGTLPTAAEATDEVGVVCAEAAGEAGLPAGTPVRAGGEDTSSAALAVGALDAGDAYLSLGTAGVVGVTVPAGSGDEPRLLSFPHVRVGLDLLSGSMTSAGAALTWWAGITDRTVGELLAEADEATADTEGLTFVPYLAGELHPINDPDARGALAGLSLATGRVDLTRAIVAGSAAAVAHNLEVAAECGTPARRLLATGRPTRSALWMREVADATGVPVDVTDTDGAAFGDALIAACSHDDELAPLVRAHQCVLHTIEPDPARHAAAAHRRRRIAALYRTMKEVT